MRRGGRRPGTRPGPRESASRMISPADLAGRMCHVSQARPKSRQGTQNPCTTIQETTQTRLGWPPSPLKRNVLAGSFGSGLGVCLSSKRGLSFLLSQFLSRPLSPFRDPGETLCEIVCCSGYNAKLSRMLYSLREAALLGTRADALF